MKRAIIDIGSNSMRLTVYETEGTAFKTLFKEKIMAGLAGYIENGALSQEGIARACEGLRAFQSILEALSIEDVAVFATASLRNIVNTDEAVYALKAATGYDVEVISGEEEALYGHLGAMRELDLSRGAYVDVGGASTEIAIFGEGQPIRAASFPVGSLSLYKACVKKLLPGEGSFRRMGSFIRKRIDDKNALVLEQQPTLVCVGGTARAALRAARHQFSLPADCRTITAQQLEEVCAVLFKSDKAAADLILKLEPDRIHTMIPGLMILRHIARLFGAERILVSEYGVREGYLCQKILSSK